MRLVVFSHKPCWSCEGAPAGYASDGGFPFQMNALAQLFDETVLLVPCGIQSKRAGEMAISGPGLRVAALPPVRGTGLWHKFLFPFWLVRCAPVLLRELFRADAVHAPIPGDVGTIGMLLAWIFRKPLFVRYCGNWLTVNTSADRFWHRFMERFAGGRNVMLATGGADHAPSARNPQIYWIFSTSLTEAELAELSDCQRVLKSGQLRLITVGRQEGAKGTELLIRALPQIHRQYPAAVLEVVGDGSGLAALKGLAMQLGLGASVVFRGKLNHTRVLECMQGADVFCLPSQSEGFPKVVLEAMACGLPVLATPVSVLPRLLAAGGGELIQPEPGAIARAVCDLVGDAPRYRGMSFRARATVADYSLERWRDTIGGRLETAWGALKVSGQGAVGLECTPPGQNAHK